MAPVLDTAEDLSAAEPQLQYEVEMRSLYLRPAQRADRATGGHVHRRLGAAEQRVAATLVGRCADAAGTAADRTALPGMPFVMYQSMAFGSSGAAPCPDKTLMSFLAAS